MPCPSLCPIAQRFLNQSVELTLSNFSKAVYAIAQEDVRSGMNEFTQRCFRDA
jgi:hypothetical protein